MASNLTPMQAELLQRADAIFSKVAEVATSATNFAMNELPDIAYQYILYNRAYLTAIIALAVVSIITQQILTLRYVSKTNKKLETENKCKYDNDEHYFMYVISTVFTFAVFGTMFLVNFKDFAMVWFAPKIFLITNIVHMVKG